MKKNLQYILANQSFEDLEPYKNSNNWKKLPQEDRNLLGTLFVMLGEKQLAAGDIHAGDSFLLASKVASDCPEVFYRLGVAFANSEIKEDIKLAIVAFDRCMELDPQNYKALQALANLNKYLGMEERNQDFFVEANKYYEKIVPFLPAQDDEEQAKFYWNWGSSYYCQGKLSGETIDFHKALEKFRTAADKGLQDKHFWNFYGDALGEFARLMGRSELYYEVAELYRNAVRQAFDFFEGWYNLGCALMNIFEMDPSEENYTQSAECFKMASQIDDKVSILWFKWGQLSSNYAKLTKNLDLLNESLLLFEKAHELTPDQAVNLALWGEALMLCGAHEERVDLLQLAQQKIKLSLEIDPDAPEAWYIYGSCFNELGRYFGEEQYYHLAIEKYQCGLAIKQNDPLLWYGLALSHFAIGELLEEVQWIEKSVRLCSRVVEFGGQEMRQFWNDWGVALMKWGEMTGDKGAVEVAVEKFEHLLGTSLEEDDLLDIETEWLYNYGCALDFLGDYTEDPHYYEKAIHILEKVLHIDPSYNHARYNLALAYAHLGELVTEVECFHKSIEHFQILLSHDSEDEMGWNEYGVTLIHLGQLINDPSHSENSRKLHEIAELKLMHAAGLGCTQSYYNLACLYSLMGNYLASLHFLEKAENAGTLPPIDELLQDEWLQGLRSTTNFRNFLSHLPGYQISDIP